MKIDILIVEDNPITTMSLSMYLNEIDINVVGEVSYGEELVEAFKKHKPNLIILDIMLRGKVDGVESASDLREISDVPILFISALSDQLSMKRMEKISNSDYITKPYDYDQMKNKIMSLL